MVTLFLIAELALLYFLSILVAQRLYQFFFLLFHIRSIAVSIVLLLFFPGTVLHELAHLFTAEILRVPTGKMRLEPESIREDTITSGSVMIAQTDPFRRYAIGLAPLFWGMTVLTAIAYFLPSLWTSVTASKVPVFSNPDLYWLLLAGYGLFSISNNMFSSPADLEGFFPFFLVVLLFIAAGYFFGIRIVLTGAVLEAVLTVVQTLTKSLGVVIGINIALLSIVILTQSVLLRIFHARIVS